MELATAPTALSEQRVAAVRRRSIKYSSQVPQEILSDAGLNRMIGFLPSNYNFEIHKSVYQIQKNGYRKGMGH
jgi:2-(3-amino-3-carboxypropyl)histidine synthase